MEDRHGKVDDEIKYERHDALINVLFHEIKKLNASIAAIEIRQHEIENLLQHDSVKSLIQCIPSEQGIKRMFEMIERHPISDIRDTIDGLREYLQEMVDRFTF